jgi:hypothetical protein
MLTKIKNKKTYLNKILVLVVQDAFEVDVLIVEVVVLWFVELKQKFDEFLLTL